MKTWLLAVTVLVAAPLAVADAAPKKHHKTPAAAAQTDTTPAPKHKTKHTKKPQHVEEPAPEEKPVEREPAPVAHSGPVEQATDDEVPPARKRHR